jgi:hypothetical protein
MKPHGIDVLRGAAGLCEFFTDVADHAAAHGGEIVQFGIDEPLFRQTMGREFSDSYMQRMMQATMIRFARSRSRLNDGVGGDLMQTLPWHHRQRRIQMPIP